MLKYSIFVVIAFIFLIPPFNNCSLGVEQNSESELKGERYALLIGVQQYDKTSGLRPLGFTHQDVSKFEELLRKAGCRKENIILMCETQEDPRLLPERDKILHQLTSLLRDRAPEDSIIIGFAGHGVQFSGDNDSYFCPLDADIGKKETLVAIGDVYQQLEQCAAGFKLVLCDACRDDPLTPTARGLAMLKTENQQPDIEPPTGIASFYSCSKGEAAIEDPDLRHGVFFHFVIQGLIGGADLDDDRVITLPELEYFVKRRVVDYVRSEFNGRRQMPNLRGNTSGLASLINLPDEKLTISLPAGAVEEKLLTDDDAPTQYDPIIVDYTNSVGMPFRLVPQGDFMMGAADNHGFKQSDEMPQHKVTISKPYFLGVYEVTQREYTDVMGENPSFFTPDNKKGRNQLERARDVSSKPNEALSSIKTDFHPVENLTWLDAVEFCRRLSKREGRIYRLPTEAEWEYACKAGSESEWFWGDDYNGKVEMFQRKGSCTGPVGSLAPNKFGFYDMIGNVREFCSDFYDADYYAKSPTVDPTGPSKGMKLRVTRGGHFDFTIVTCNRRMYSPEAQKTNNLGLRVVLELSEEELKLAQEKKTQIETNSNKKTDEFTESTMEIRLPGEVEDSVVDLDSKFKTEGNRWVIKFTVKLNETGTFFVAGGVKLENGLHERHHGYTMVMGDKGDLITGVIDFPAKDTTGLWTCGVYRDVSDIVINKAVQPGQPKGPRRPFD